MSRARRLNSNLYLEIALQLLKSVHIDQEIVEVGSTLYCGAGPSFSSCSFFFLACRLLRLVGLLPRPTPGILTTYFGSGFDFFSGRTT